MGMTIPAVVVVAVLCYAAGETAKALKIKKAQIPIITMISGILFGIVAMYVVPDYPAGDVLTAAALGALSGLASTGLYESIGKGVITRLVGSAEGEKK